MTDLDFVVSPVQTKVEINDQNNEDFIPGTLNIYSLEVDSEDENVSHYDAASRPKVKTKGNIILFPQPSNSCNDPLNWSKWRKLSNFLLSFLLLLLQQLLQMTLDQFKIHLMKIWN